MIVLSHKTNDQLQIFGFTNFIFNKDDVVNTHEMLVKQYAFVISKEFNFFEFTFIKHGIKKYT